MADIMNRTEIPYNRCNNYL